MLFRSKKICAAIDQLREMVGSPVRRSVTKPPEASAELKSKVDAAALEGIRTALRTPGKHERRDALAAAKVAAVAAATADLDDTALEKIRASGRSR